MMTFDFAKIKTILATPGQDRTTLLLGAVAVVAVASVFAIGFSDREAPVAQSKAPEPVAEAPAAQPTPSAEPQVATIPPPASDQSAPAAEPGSSVASVNRAPSGGVSVAAQKPAMEIAPPEKTAAAKDKTKAKSKTAEAKPKVDKKATKMAKAAPSPERPPPSPKGGMPSLNAQAQGYVTFARDIDTISAMKLQSPTEVRNALHRLKRHQPKQMTEGWIAYGAEIAGENKKFAASLAKEIEKRGRKGVASKIEKDPSYVLELRGAYDAMNDILASVSSDTAKLNTLQERFISTAYEFQKIKKWGMLEENVPQDELKSFASLPTSPLPEVAHNYVIPAGLFGGGKSKAPAMGNATGPTQSALVLAARLAASDAPSTRVGDAGLEQCLRWARLNLNQCMAASHFPSEEAYCTGKHALAEVSACWSQLLPTKS